MPVSKYADLHAQAGAGPVRRGEVEFPEDWTFSLDRLEPESAMGRLAARLTQKAFGPIYAYSRRHRPILPFAGLLHVTRAEQVREILLRPADFRVPFGPEMAELGDGATFLLGLDDAPHERLHPILRSVLRPEDKDRIGQMAERFTAALLDNSPGRIDVVADLIKRVPTEICLRYFGLQCADPNLFGDWTMALSAYLFGDPFGDEETRRLAVHASQRLAALIDDAIERHRLVLHKGSQDIAGRETIVERFLLAQQASDLTDKEIRAMLIGLAVGFVPTNTLANANMLMELFKHPEAMALARKAALDGDRETMRKVVLEAGRLNPALAPGQWRYCPHDAEITIDGRIDTIPAGSTLLVSTMSALRDPREWDEPKRFRIDRTNKDGSPKEPNLLFGVGPHRCLGEHHAMGQIAGLFMELLNRDNLRPAPGKAGKMAYAGPFPRHMELTYSSLASQQSMFLVLVPVTSGASQEELEEHIARLGHPAKGPIRDALDDTGLLHFASLSPLESERGLDLVFELSCDGPIKPALEQIAAKAGDLLRPIFELAGMPAGAALAPFMQSHVVELHGKMWGPTGLNFNGLGDFPVARVERETRFADFAGRVLRDYVASETSRGSHPSLTLGHLRRILRGDPALKAEATPAQRVLMEEAQREGWDAFHLATDTMRLSLARFRERSGWGEIFSHFFASKDARIVTWPLAMFWVAGTAAAWFALGGGMMSRIFVAPVIGFLLAMVIAGIVLGTYFVMLRRAETRDIPSTAQANDTHMTQIAAGEDFRGYRQNHVFVVGKLKAGYFRIFLHALALWSIRILLTYGIRPGFVWNMGTIHYARWWRLPRTRTVAFFSNFDGSWENYLEDFIVRAHEGQTAAWSNWEGFPKTRFLALDGALDSDAFKQFTRTVQRVSPFWYARFPELTSDQIRNNGQIRIGAGLARTATEAEEWVRCFSSMPRTENLVESDEVQALVLRGMKRLPYSTCLSLRLPQQPQSLGEWLCWVRGRPMRVDGAMGAGGEDAIAELLREKVLETVPREDGQEAEYALSHALSIAFGDRPLLGLGDSDSPDALAMGQAAFLAISAAGLARFDAPHRHCKDVLNGLPYPFRTGMAARSRVLGDFGEDAPESWRWHDDPDRHDPTEAVMMLYASTPEALERMVMVHSVLLGNHGGELLHRTDCAPAWPEIERADFEHFGFRDGISQPVMRGSTRSTRGVPDRDVVEPGEFIIGYKNDSGYLPESPRLPTDADISGALPVVIDQNLLRYTDFGDTSLADAPRDLGRNGSFLVLRELKQDVEGFHQDACEAARRLNEGGYRDLYKLVGQRPDAEWVKAKLMGRWRDGRPLIGNPVYRDGDAGAGAEVENDFSYAQDDPQGLACPFGAHIRRTNPRDSKNPGDAEEQDISNRHRLLRRGRPYRRQGESGEEKGLLFACFCTDLERQFEFVQQFWANAPAFHGLDKEPDPIIGADPVTSRREAPLPRGFTIPTAAGPVRLEGLRKHVQVMGGGYFFMPSRSALGWLSETALRAARHAQESECSNG
ncbi:MAG: cytochrome P450 [Sphingomonadaceae bacterium]|nr:cytochrome P450 [Sphingomonadaceae bacterium]